MRAVYGFVDNVVDNTHRTYTKIIQICMKTTSTFGLGYKPLRGLWVYKYFIKFRGNLNLLDIHRAVSPHAYQILFDLIINTKR